MNEQLLLMILIVHWIADFVLQTHNQATKKSTSKKYLADHVLVYSFVWLLITVAILEWKCLAFFAITFICHFTTDYFTSKMAKKRFDAGDYHNGFVVIGFDQILHYIQLYLTFKYLL